MIKQTLTERLTQLTKDFRDIAETMPPGAKREALLRAAMLNENALQIQKWLSSPGLRAPN
jgi:hypothetical protein